jgi:hypothetical protein
VISENSQLLIEPKKSNVDLFSQISTNLVYNCETVFWTINQGGDIKQWDLINNQITGGEIVLTSQINSFAFCSTYNEINNLTFYGTNNLTTGLKKYDDATGSWSTITTSQMFINNGGYYQHQYYRNFDNKKIYYYNGFGFNLLDSFDNFTNILVADTPVDSMGRAWIFIGNMITGEATSVRVYDSGGLIATYPFNFNLQSNYGATFINDILYISKLNTLVPIEINGSILTIGEPIPFLNDSYRDLASCNKQQPLNNIGFNQQNLFKIYPNPTNSILFIETTEDIYDVSMFSVDGKLLKSIINNNQIDLSNLSSSTYFLKIITPNNIYIKSVIKQ